MMADPTQLRLASGREEAYQELHDSHPMPWTARREPQKLQKGSFWTSPHVLQKMMKIRGRTHLGTCKQTLSKHKHKNSSLQGNDFSQKQSTTAAKAATTCLQVHTWRTHQKQDRTGASDETALEIQFEMETCKNAFQKTCRDMLAFVTSAARKRRKDVFERQMSFEERKQFDPAKQKEIKNFVVNNVLEKLEPHEKPPRECKLRMRWVLEYRLDENEKKRLPSLAL